MRARSWAFCVGLPVGVLPLGVLGTDPGPWRTLVAVALVAAAGVVLAGLFDDGTAPVGGRVLAAAMGVAVLPLLPLLLDAG